MSFPVPYHETCITECIALGLHRGTCITECITKLSWLICFVLLFVAVKKLTDRFCDENGEKKDHYVPYLVNLDPAVVEVHPETNIGMYFIVVYHWS